MKYVTVVDPMTNEIDPTTVIFYSDDGSISYLNQWSRLWLDYQQWLSEGNTPLPAK